MSLCLYRICYVSSFRKSSCQVVNSDLVAYKDKSWQVIHNHAQQQVTCPGLFVLLVVSSYMRHLFPAPGPVYSLFPGPETEPSSFLCVILSYPFPIVTLILSDAIGLSVMF